MQQLARVLTRLNLETRSVHAAIDQRWSALLGDSVALEHSYVRALVRMYGFEAPLDAALAYTPQIDSILDETERYRSPLVVHDLVVAGADAAQVASAPHCLVAPFTSVAEALGWIYMRERIHRFTLGPRGRRFSSTYFRATSTYDTLGRLLERHAETPPTEDCTVGAAHRAFRALEQWLASTPTRVPRTKYGPKCELSPSLGDPCRLCGDPLLVGDYTTLVRRESDRKYADRGAEVHWSCAQHAE